MNNMIISLLSSLIENLVIVQIMNYYLEARARKTWIAFVVCFSVFALFVNTMESPFYLLTALGLLIGFAKLQYKNSFGYICFVSSGIFILNAFLSFAIISFMNVFDADMVVKLSEDAIFYFSIVLISKFLLILLCYLFRKLLKPTGIMNWNLILAELLLFFIAIIYSFYVYIRHLVSAIDALVLMGIMVLMFAITFCVLIKYFKEKQQKAEIKAKFNMTEKEQMLIGVSQKALHDFSEQIILLKNHIERIAKDNGDPDVLRLQEIVSGIGLEHTPVIVDTDNMLLNHILNIKTYMLSSLNIKFKAVFENTLKHLDDYDLIFLFTTLIDHMIKVCDDETDPMIEVAVNELPNSIKLTVCCKCTKEQVCFEDAYLRNFAEMYGGCYENAIDKEKYIHTVLFPKAIGA